MRVPISSVLAPFLVVSVAAAQTQTIQPGQIYQGGTRVSAPAAGVSFDVPPGTQGGYDGDAEGFLVVDRSRQGEVIGVFAFSAGSVEEIGAGLIDELVAQGIQLQARTGPQFDGTTLRASFTAFVNGGQAILLGVVRSGPPGNSVAILGLGPSANESGMRDRMDGILASAQFAPPQATQWSQMLAGVRLVYLGQASSYSPGGVGDGSYASQREQRYDFCGNGGYAYYMHSESYISVEGAGGMSSTSEDAHQGSWSLVADIIGAAYLVLEASDGREFLLRAEETANGVVVGEDIYRAERSPACY